MMKHFIILIPFVFFFFNIQAQRSESDKKNGQITGKVIDVGTKNPIEYASITVYTFGSTKPVNGIISNTKGVFKVDGLAPGTYTVTIDFIGYTINKMDSIVITTEKQVVSLGNVSLTRTSQTLQNVTVTGSSSIIENKIDKMIYNVEKDITSQGGVATDVLKKVPQVFVDVDGNVELQGSSSIRFLINGKPSTIFGNSIADALQSIPASQIQSIEVITSPGAKYDAQGTGGIINIILKKSNVQGINGNINLSAGTRLENGSLNLNYRHNQFGMNAYFSGNAQLATTTINELSRVSTDTSSSTKTNLLQNSNSGFVRNGYQTGIGFDWGFSKTNNLTGSLGYHHFNNNNNGITYQETIATDFSGTKLSDTNTIRNSTNNFNAHSIDWSLNYKKTFKKDNQELDIAYNSSYGTNNSYYFQTQNYQFDPSPFAGSNSRNPGTSNESEFSIDYTHPVNDNFTVETGVKNEQSKISSKADVYTFNPNSKSYFLDPTQSYSLSYKRNVYAYYLSASFSLFHFLDIKAGGRYEYTDSKADFSNAHNVNVPSYSIFAPSFVVSHSFSKNQTLKFSYTHRIERPDYRDLNPFVNLSDPHNISTGNPQLRPELGNNFELGYNHSFEKGSNINLSLIYRKNTDDITSYTSFYPSYKIGDSVYSDVSVTTQQNVNSDERYGINLSGTLSVNTKFTLRSNIFAFNHRIYSILNGGSTNTGYGYRMNLNGTYLINKDFAFEFFGNFRSKETNVQGTQTSFISYNLAMRKYFLKKKLSIGLTTTNPFNKYVNQTRETLGSNFHQISTRQIPFRSFGINLMYKFGKLEFKKIKENESDNQSAPF
jgi:ferric enterobactin receptor